MSATRIKVGVVGVGHLGQHHARLYGELSGAELVGVVDQDAQRAQEIAKKNGCDVYASVAELAQRIDAASVAVPTVAHRQVAEELLLAGIDVLVEKPLAPTLDDADAINATAETAGKLVMVGHTERFNPAIEALRDVVAKPQFLEIHRLAAFSARSTDIDVVLDLMIHDLDLLLSLDGTEAVSVDAVGIAALTGKVDIANARVRMASGCIANVTASRISVEPLRRLRIFQPQTYLSCDTGKRLVERFKLDASAEPSPKIVYDKLPIADGEPLANELSAFLEAVRTRSRPVIDGRDGRRALALAYTVLESIAEHRERR